MRYSYIKNNPLYRINPSKEFRIVYQPNYSINGRSRRFLIGFNTLIKYVGSHNAFSSLLRALNSKQYKYRVRLRKYGIIDFYSK